MGNSKSSQTSTNSSRSDENELDNNNIRGGTEIWICTKSVPLFNIASGSFRLCFSGGGVISEDRPRKVVSVPVFKHWILLVKFRATTLWMEAFERDGVLVADILDSEPEGVEDRIFVGKITLSVKEMLNLFDNSNLVGEKYSLFGANCQSWIKGIIEKLSQEVDITIINDMISPIR